MPRIRLAASASITPTAAGVILRSDLGTFQITGVDLAAFLSRIAPLLDGSRDRAAVAASVDGYAPRSVAAFLEVLAERGLLEDVPDVAPPLADRFRGQDEFLRRWPSAPADAMERLAGARVLVAGLEPWGAAAAVELAASGLGALHLLDEGGDDVAPRREALADRIRALSPWCRVGTGATVALDADGAPWTLLVAAVPPGDEAQVERVARFAHRSGVRSLWSHLASQPPSQPASHPPGATAFLGPLTVPGKTACRLCVAVEALNPPLADDALHVAPGTGADLMAEILGHLVAMEGIKVITEYAPSPLSGQLLVVDPETLVTKLHRLVRLPWCRVCREDVSPAR